MKKGNGKLERLESSVKILEDNMHILNQFVEMIKHKENWDRAAAIAISQETSDMINSNAVKLETISKNIESLKNDYSNLPCRVGQGQKEKEIAL